MIVSILIGVLSSLSASGLFLLVLFRLRPRIEISPEIADQSNDDGPCDGDGLVFLNGLLATPSTPGKGKVLRGFFKWWALPPKPP